MTDEKLSLNYLICIVLGVLICPPAVTSIISSLLHQYESPYLVTIIICLISICLFANQLYRIKKRNLTLNRKQFPTKTYSTATDTIQPLSLSLKGNESFAVLTPQEKALVDLILQGYTGNSIAKTMNISFETQKSYRKSVYSKLNVHSREEIFSLANKEK